MRYIPQPIITDDIQLSRELNELMEQLARNVHEVWASGRVADGWQYGEKRDDNLKLHPCLIPYDELPDREKDFDRKTSCETLKLILKLGFEIKNNLLY